LALLSSIWVTAAQAETAAIVVNPGEVIATTPREVIGVNLEDLNFQTYGGLYSQLIGGESFQEHVDSAVLGLTGLKRLAVYVTEKDGRLVLTGGRNANAIREAVGLASVPGGQPVVMGPPPEQGVFGAPGAKPVLSIDELPAAQRAALLAAAAPGHQVSRQWRGFATKATGRFDFERAKPFIGIQSQNLTFVSGAGEVGMENAGSNRTGINLVAGRPYEGLLRIRATGSQTVWVSLLDASGKRKLAEKPIQVVADGTYRAYPFTITPASGDARGRFAISLKGPGTVTVGYAFLQPGDWGRFKGLPVRRDLAQALLDQGVKAIRYDGSMVSGAVDQKLYKWKEMIGPRDLRKPYTGAYNPYASHGFGIFDFLDFAEAAGVMAIPGVRIDETPEDMADFVEYVNGPVTTPWGARRAADGHPAPYNLRHLEFGNEHPMSAAYRDQFEKLAKAVWAKDPKMILLIANSLIAPGGRESPAAARAVWEVGPDGSMSPQLENAVHLMRFAQANGGEIWWDQHFQAFPNDYQDSNSAPTIDVIPVLKASIDKLVPGNTLKIAALEENGASANLRRALVHARNLNAFFRLGSLVPAVAIANAFEASGQALSWDQGVTGFTPSSLFHQPTYYVDQAVSRFWAPKVVRTRVTGPLDAQARLSEDGRQVVLMVVNEASAPVESTLRIAGTELSPAKPTEIIELTGPDEGRNTAEHPAQVVPVSRTWENWTAVARYTFPARSVTLFRFAR
jgi:alpha-L-arabinofuranosidase